MNNRSGEQKRLEISTNCVVLVDLSLTGLGDGELRHTPQTVGLHVNLDEPTSSLDRRTDERIQLLLRTSLMDKTVITIAHRLESLERYDQIVELADGRLSGQGEPDEMITILQSRYSEVRDILINVYFLHDSVGVPSGNLAKLRRFRDFPPGAPPCPEENIQLIRASLVKSYELRCAC